MKSENFRRFNYWKTALAGAGLLLLGMWLGRVLFSAKVSPQHDSPVAALHHHHPHDHADAGKHEPAIWTCSMHPSIREEQPGTCPICAMDLTPVAGRAETDDFSMVMSVSAMQLAEIQTTPVRFDIPARTLSLPGRIRVDERRLTRITTHFSGRIISSKVNFTGAPIRKGQSVASVYSPELIAAQRELLEAVRQRENHPRLYESARQKFRYWNFSEEQIDHIVQRGEVQREMELLSPEDGHVLSRYTTDQQYFSEGTILYEVADLNHLWVVLEAYEEDLPWVSVGDTVRFRSRSQPGHVQHTVISYIDPVVDPARRTVGLRADIRNVDGNLRPEMLVTGTLISRSAHPELLVPVSSVLWTGPRSLVYVRDPDAEVPRFEAREVTLGMRAGDFYVIEEGVEAEEEVVFHGAFLIDSEFQLADRFSMMNRQPGSGAVPAHNHAGHGPADHEQELTNGDARSSDHQIIKYDDVSEAFHQQLAQLTNEYLLGKDALVLSNETDARNYFSGMESILDRIGEHGLAGSGHQAWMHSHSSMKQHLERMSEAAGLQELREGFRDLSDELILAVRQFGLRGVIYHQYCPMAFDDAGASWLSDESRIMNPYLPETMLMCGEIIERLDP